MAGRERLVEDSGAPVWQTPLSTPRSDSCTSRPETPHRTCSARSAPSDNLYSSSILALDAKTGEYRWHFQEVHHDIWDYDAPSPVVLFDVTIDGQQRHALGQAGKTGFVYILDRETGKPLIGVHERAVPQNRAQKTSPTQPFPVGDGVVPQRVPHDAFQRFLPDLPKGTKFVNGGRIFTPYGPGGAVVATPSSLGGTNWWPMSFNPKTGFLYVCGLEQAQLFEGGKSAPYKAGKEFAGSIFAPQASPTGTFTAIDASTNRIAWQNRFPDSCYSGSTTTAGNLTFVGRNDGHLQAYDAGKGNLLWSFQTGAGANNTATVFSLDGKEVVAFYAAGSALAGALTVTTSGCSGSTASLGRRRRARSAAA